MEVGPDEVDKNRGGICPRSGFFMPFRELAHPLRSLQGLGKPEPPAISSGKSSPHIGNTNPRFAGVVSNLVLNNPNPDYDNGSRSDFLRMLKRKI